MTKILYAILPEIGLVSIGKSQYDKHIVERAYHAIREQKKRDALFYAVKSGRVRNIFAYLQHKKIEQIKLLRKSASYIALQHEFYWDESTKEALCAV
jgi:hypothetical protein